MHIIVITLVIILSLISVNCAVNLNANCRNFSLELVYFTAFGNEPSNIVLSPFSLWTLMSGLLFGASGVSRTELGKALILLRKNETDFIDDYTNLKNQVVNDNSTGVSLKSENTVLMDDQFKVSDDFGDNIIHRIKRINVNLTELDVAAGMTYDNLPESGVQVRNVITLKDSSRTRMVFVNGMHFKGLWGLPFDRSATEVAPFYDEQGKVIGEVNMMYRRGKFPFTKIIEMNAFALELPFGDEGRYCMLILLPWTGRSIREVYENLSEFPIKNIFYEMYNDTQRYGLEDVDIRIPRFKIGTHVELVKPLNEMNVKAIFAPRSSGFGRFTSESIYVSSVTQIADIEVTENGLVASDSLKANSTHEIVTPGYIANKPFIYFIIEKTTVSIIYAGAYSIPTVY